MWGHASIPKGREMTMRVECYKEMIRNNFLFDECHELKVWLEAHLKWRAEEGEALLKRLGTTQGEK